MINRRWHRFAIQVRPDSVAECYWNGVLLGKRRIPPEAWGKPYLIILSGRAEDTEIYHGRVVVTRGLRY